MTLDNGNQELDEFLRGIIENSEEDIIDSLSEGLVYDTLFKQIDDVLTQDSTINDNSFFDYFEERYIYMKHLFDNNKLTEEEMGKVNIAIITISDKIIKTVGKKFGFFIQLNELTDVKTILLYAKSIYEFFILRIKDNSCNFINNYIFDNKKSIVKLFKDNFDIAAIKDEMSYRYIKEMMDNDFTLVVYNLKDIIHTATFNTAEDVIEQIIKTDLDELTNNTIERIFINQESIDDIDYNKDFLKVFQEFALFNSNALMDIRSDIFNTYKEYNLEGSL